MKAPGAPPSQARGERFSERSTERLNCLFVHMDSNGICRIAFVSRAPKVGQKLLGNSSMICL